jgi:protein-tyrosine phosphatase
MKSQPAQTVLMVCLGNICRSPMAEGALRHHAAMLGLRILVDSAGTGSWHVGHPPDIRAQEVARRLGGVDISALSARQLCIDDFRRFDHIIAMDRSNLRNLTQMAPIHSAARLGLLLDHLPTNEGQSIADPYHGDVVDFEECWRRVEAATRCLASALKIRTREN